MIFCVEDDNSIRDLMIYTLNASGFEASGFSDGEQLFEALKEKKPELIILDIMLPGEDGITILKKLRSHGNTSDIPVIMATAKGTEYDKVIGLDSGADDYLAKPFGMMEFVARVKALLRRSKKVPYNRRLGIGKLELDVNKHVVTVDGEETVLTLKEFQLLQYLLENVGIVLSRDQLLAHIWGSDFDGETRTVDVHIRTLRQKRVTCGELIETVRGVGYRIGEPR